MGNQIDFNCDMGESFGMYKMGLDEEVIKYITLGQHRLRVSCGRPELDAPRRYNSRRSGVWQSGRIQASPTSRGSAGGT